MLLLGHQFGEIVELGVFLNLGGRLLNQESQVGLQLEDLCRVVRVDQLKRLLKVKDRNIRKSIFDFYEVALHSFWLLSLRDSIQVSWSLNLGCISINATLRRRLDCLNLL